MMLNQCCLLLNVVVEIVKHRILGHKHAGSMPSLIFVIQIRNLGRIEGGGGSATQLGITSIYLGLPGPYTALAGGI